MGDDDGLFVRLKERRDQRSMGVRLRMFLKAKFHQGSSLSV